MKKTSSSQVKANQAKAGTGRKPAVQAAKSVAAAPRKAIAAKAAVTHKVSASTKPASTASKAGQLAGKTTAKAKAPAAKAAVAKSVAKLGPVKAVPATKAPVIKVVAVAPAPVAAKPVAPPAPAPIAEIKKPVSQRHGFKTGEYIVYPAHGVGRVLAIEEQEIAGLKLELFVITFEKDKMTLRVPTAKTQSVGMRKLAETVTVDRAMETLKGRARIKRTMWSRRAQEYEAKINSGDLIAIAEVVRDLYRSESQPEQSYSERQLYEAALDRMAREVAAVEKLDDRGAVQKITEVLARSARGLRVEPRPAEEGTDGQENHQAA
jgi:CarD family transcriptional regulator